MSIVVIAVLIILIYYPEIPTECTNVRNDAIREYVKRNSITHLFTDRPINHYADHEWSYSSSRWQPLLPPWKARPGKLYERIFRHGHIYLRITYGLAGSGRVPFIISPIHRTWGYPEYFMVSRADLDLLSLINSDNYINYKDWTRMRGRLFMYIITSGRVSAWRISLINQLINQRPHVDISRRVIFPRDGE